MHMTIKDIARLAEVSTATVSKVLNNKAEHISPATRERVMRVAAENNYTPNRIASSLVTRRTHTIGLIIPDITDPFLPELVRGAEEKAKEEGYNLILCNTNNQGGRELEYIHMLHEKMVDGLIFTCSFDNELCGNQMPDVSMPVILVDRDIDGLERVGRIRVDNRKGAEEAVSYLIGRGYRRILHLTGPSNSVIGAARLQGYEDALDNAGIFVDPNFIMKGQFNTAWGIEGIRKALGIGRFFDAVFCGSDSIALGAMKAIKDAGLSIPKDMGVVGFDDIELAKLVDPTLTTVRQPNYALGYEAVSMLASCLKDAAYEPGTLSLSTELVIRESVR